MERPTEKCLALDIESKAEEIPKSLFKKLYGQASRVKWFNVILLLTMHILALVGYLYTCTHDIHLHTVFFAAAIGLFSGMGMSVGAHRLWAHRSFKARLPLRIILLLLQAMTMNGR